MLKPPTILKGGGIRSRFATPFHYFTLNQSKLWDTEEEATPKKVALKASVCVVIMFHVVVFAYETKKDPKVYAQIRAEIPVPCIVVGS